MNTYLYIYLCHKTELVEALYVFFSWKKAVYASLNIRTYISKAPYISRTRTAPNTRSLSSSAAAQLTNAATVIH